MTGSNGSFGSAAGVSFAAAGVSFGIVGKTAGGLDGIGPVFAELLVIEAGAGLFAVAGVRGPRVTPTMAGKSTGALASELFALGEAGLSDAGSGVSGVALAIASPGMVEGGAGGVNDLPVANPTHSSRWR